MEIGRLEFSAITNTDCLSSFKCGIDEMDDYIHHKLHNSINARFCKAFSVSLDGKIVAFFALNFDSLELDYQEAYDVIHRDENPIDINLEFEEAFKDKHSYPALEISFLAVCEKFHCKHIGTRIIDEIIRMAKNQTLAGCQFITVMAYDPNPEDSAVGFYQKIGFSVLGRRNKDTVRMYKPVFVYTEDDY